MTGGMALPLREAHSSMCSWVPHTYVQALRWAHTWPTGGTQEVQQTASSVEGGEEVMEQSCPGLLPAPVLPYPAQQH